MGSQGPGPDGSKLGDSAIVVQQQSHMGQGTQGPGTKPGTQKGAAQEHGPAHAPFLGPRLDPWPLGSLAHMVRGLWVPGLYLQGRNMTLDNPMLALVLGWGTTSKVLKVLSEL